MTSERWQQINAVLDAVLEQPPARRQAYLDQECQEDHALRQEVESLLEAYAQAENFLEEPAKAYAAPLIPMAEDAADGLIGQMVDGYRILRVVGYGGMGIVYEAEDEALSRKVAIKMINPQLARDETFVIRFRREARALARIDSRHIVRVHAMRQMAVGVFIVMEYVDGGTVNDLLRNGPLSLFRALPIIQQMLTGLEHAHSLDVIHRDIKPSNIMITGQGVVKVTDFGLAKVPQSGGAVTVTQGIAGTLYYMSPEQVLGASDLDHRSDLYSMGITIYKMLTGHLPIDVNATEFDIMESIVQGRLPSPSSFKPDLSAEVDAVIMKAIEREPAQRYQSAAEMRKAFESLQPSPDARTVVQAASPYKTTRQPKKRNQAEKQPEKKPQPLKPPQRSGQGLTLPPVLWGAIAALGLAVMALVGYLLWPRTIPTLMSLTTVPGYATVFVDGDSIGTTPLADHRLAADVERVYLRVQKANYAPIETTLVAIAGTPLALRLTLKALAVEIDTIGTPRRATLRIASSPGNTRVQVNGKNMGTTNASGVLDGLVVDPGNVTVRLTRAGYTTWERRYRVDAGQTLNVPVALALAVAPPAPTPIPDATGRLTVQVLPQGRVSVDSEDCEAGASCAVSAGPQTVTCSRGGYETTKRVQVSAGGHQTVTCFTEQKVVVQVRNEEGAPIWGTILVDGTNEGQFPDKVLTLAPGNYLIEVRRNEFETLTSAQSIQVRPSFEEAQHLMVFQIRRQ